MENLARAFDVEVSDVHQPAVRPGYAAWVSLWRAPSGELLLAFCEKRRLPNPSYRPIPLDFMEAMSLPIKYQVSFCNGSPDIRTESVIMRSRDEGRTWTEVGRSDAGGLMNIFAYTSLPDGSILRGINTSYLSFGEDEQPFTGIEKSTDSGASWSRSSILLERDLFGYPYRLKRLRDGTLVLLCPCISGFGPGRPRRLRGTNRPNALSELQIMLFLSADEGRSWTGPIIVLPAITAPEPDFAELPSGDLIILNSSVQGGPQVRQYVHRGSRGFIPGTVFRVSSGTVPETLCATSSGLLVGASRNGLYTCSKDDGATWHTISGMPKCNYQPQIIELSDGRFLCVWHRHGDCVFGEFHQFVGQHAFGLDVSRLPEAAALGLQRDMNRERTRYVNACTARLTAGCKPQSHRKVRFWTQMRYRDTYDLSPPAPEPKEEVKETDENGEARLELSELYLEIVRELNIHQSYTIRASFSPEEGDSLSPAESPSFHAYIMSPEKGKRNNYPLYVAGAKLFFDPGVLEELLEIKSIIEGFGKSREIDGKGIRERIGLSNTRYREVMSYLVSHNLVERSGSSGYRWRYDLSGGMQAIEVEDDFL